MNEGSNRPVRIALVLLLVAEIVVAAMLAFADCRLRPHRDPRMDTVNLVSELTRAVEAYRLDYGCYPWPKPNEVTATTEIRNPDVYRALRGRTGGVADYLGDVPRKHLKGDVLVDTWGRPIIFRVNRDGLSAVIWSCGQNGKDETNTGASPDTAKLPKTYYLFRGSSTGDDIASE